MKYIRLFLFILTIGTGIGFVTLNDSFAVIDNNSNETLVAVEETNEVETTKIDLEPIGKMTASWYGPKFDGKLTANGETYNQLAYTAAHKTLPFGTMLKITNPRNGKSVVVRINDRGPYIAGREIDLSKGAALSLGMMPRGVIRVDVEQLVLTETAAPVRTL